MNAECFRLEQWNFSSTIMRLTFINRLIVGDICQNVDFSRNRFIACFQHRIYLVFIIRRWMFVVVLRKERERAAARYGRKTKSSCIEKNLKNKEKKKNKSQCQKDPVEMRERDKIYEEQIKNGNCNAVTSGE